MEWEHNHRESTGYTAAGLLYLGVQLDDADEERLHRLTLSLYPRTPEIWDHAIPAIARYETTFWSHHDLFTEWVKIVADPWPYLVKTVL